MAVRRLTTRSNPVQIRSKSLEDLGRLHEAAVEPFFQDITEAALFDPELEIRVACAELLKQFKGEQVVEDGLPSLDAVAQRVLHRDRSRLVRKTASRFMKGVMKAQEPAVPPHCWGVRLQDLVDFHDEIFDKVGNRDLQMYCDCHKYYFNESGKCVHVCLDDKCSFEHHRDESFIPLRAVTADVALSDMIPNMHVVVAREVQPRTRPHGCSFALMKNPEGLRINAFVTHTWNEHFSDLINTLRMALEPHDAVWLCSFAIDQNNPARIFNMLSLHDLHEGPFAKALRSAPKLIVTVDAELEVPNRSWCVYEIAKACEWGIPTFVWPTHLSNLQELSDKVASLDVRNAQATKTTDNERIHECLSEGLGYDRVNTSLRVFIGDRLRFYKAAVSKHRHHLSELNQQIADARRQSDAAKLFALESARNSQLRLLQLEAERSAWLEAKQGNSDQLAKPSESASPLVEHKSRVALLTEQRDAAIESEHRCRAEIEELRNEVARQPRCGAVAESAELRLELEKARKELESTRAAMAVLQKRCGAVAEDAELRLRDELDRALRELESTRAEMAFLRSSKALPLTVCHVHRHTVLPPRHLGTVYLN